MNLWKKLLSVTVPLMLLSGCAVHRENMEIHDLCLEEPGTVIIAHIEGFEKPGFYKAGKQGLLDYAIASAVTDDVATAVEKTDVQPIIVASYYKAYGDFFEKHHFM